MQTLKFGKLPKKQDPRNLQFADYLTPALPTPPVSYSALARVYQNLKSSDPAKLFPMDGNDSLGDCTLAGVAHGLTVFRGLVGKKTIMSKAATIKLYLQLTGGEDTGLAMLDVLNYWHKHTIDKEKIGPFVEVKPKNHAHVELATQLFGGLYTGFRVQNNCIQDFNAGKPWTPGPLTNEGHCIFSVVYDPQDVSVLTWGGVQKGSWAWWDECVDEAYAILPPEANQPGFAPGFNFSQLQADLKAL
jgi:hypothetical protein